MKRQGLRPMVVCFLVVVMLAAVTGCSIKSIDLRNPSLEQESAAITRLQRLLDQPRVSAFDADVRIRWNIIGQTGAVDAMLQVQEPGLLRLTAVDPLGRSILIVVTDGSRFTLVDNREGQAITGQIDSTFIEKYVPSVILSDGLFTLLGGMVRLQGAELEGVGIDKDQNVWYRFSAGGDEEGYRVFLSEELPVLARRVLVDGENDVLLDFHYSSHRVVDGKGSLWPGQLSLTGSRVKGRIELEVKEVVGVNPLPLEHYYLSLPPGVMIEEVE